MLALDKETFSYWVTHPDDLTATDFVQLQESLQTYPYCQALHTLTAKAASIHLKGQTVPFIRQAAAFALSRNALRKMIDNEFQWSENLLTKLNELSDRHVSIPDDYQQESYALFKANTRLSNSFPRLSLLSIAGRVQESATIPTPEDQTLAETNLQQDLEQIAEAVSEPVSTALPAAERERQQQLDIINSFIQREPRISPVRLKPGEVVEQEDLTKRSGNTGGAFVTESFARILEKQGKFAKAREIYQQLMQKNPEKNAYFAAKIAQLDSDQQSAND